MFAHGFVRKINHMRKRKWSAPTIMATFIFLCMLLVYSFESIGLLNKERTSNYRFDDPVSGIKL